MNDENKLKTIVNDYFDAFEARDLSKCLGFFEDDAVVHFATGKFPGIKAIEQWHKDRFQGGMRITEIENIVVQDNRVVVDAVATSPKLKFMRIDNFKGTGTFDFHTNNKLKKLRMELRTGYRFHL